MNCTYESAIFCFLCPESVDKMINIFLEYPTAYRDTHHACARRHNKGWIIIRQNNYFFKEGDIIINVIKI